MRQTLFSLAVNMTTAVGTALVLGFGAYHVLQGQLTVGELLVVMAYIAAVYKPLETISSTVGSLQDQFVSCSRLRPARHGAGDHATRPAPSRSTRARGHVAFDDVDSATTAAATRSTDISFEAEPGQAVAHRRPDRRRQEHAGQPAAAVLRPARGPHPARRPRRPRRSRSSRCAQQISIVLQEPLLFSATIADNIRYGRLDATMDEIVEAAQAANAHDFITRLPQGYDTELGERGAQLSGGERQRIAVARAFLKDAPILILDEPTSSIDSKTEAVILDALDRLMVGPHDVHDRAPPVDDPAAPTRSSSSTTAGSSSRAPTTNCWRGDGLYRQLHDVQTAAEAAARATAGGPCPSGVDVTDMHITTRPKIVVLGMMSKMPVAGVVWLTLHYLVGLERLGYDVYYVEAHGRTPSMLMKDERATTARPLAAAFIAGMMRRFDLGRPLGVPRPARRRPLLRHDATGA